MTCLLAISGEALAESESGVENVEVLEGQSEVFVWNLKPPGLPLSVVVAAMNRVLPKVPIVVLSDSPQSSEEAFQTVNAIGAVADELFFLPMLEPFLDPKPVSLQATGMSISRKEHSCGPSSVLGGLKSVLDSFPPPARRHVISEIYSVFAELRRAA